MEILVPECESHGTSSNVGTRFAKFDVIYAETLHLKVNIWLMPFIFINSCIVYRFKGNY